jgi:hypothetical protein
MINHVRGIRHHVRFNKHRMYILKPQPNNNHVPQYKNEIRNKSTAGNRFSHMTVESRSSLLPGRCSRQMLKSFADANTVY